MRIKKIINNNIALAEDKTGLEVVIMGKGIGFNKRSGDHVQKQQVEKVFKADKIPHSEKLIELLQDVDLNCLEITEKIVSYAEQSLDRRLSKMIYVLLTDHISFALERFEKNVQLSNPMLWEIKNIYREEYEIGIWALDYIKKKMGVHLIEDEAAFIALHIVNASLDEEMSNTMTITLLTKDILRTIQQHFKLEFKEDSMDYIRLVTHLKFFSQRILKRAQQKEQDEELYELLVHRYKNVKKCVDKITKYINREYGYELTKQEQVYLILHIQRVITN